MKLISVGQQLTFLLCLSLTQLSVVASPHSAGFDPTRPNNVQVGPLAKQGTWKLTFTLITKKRKRAVINGITVTGPGDQVFGATVTKIRPGAVDLNTTTGPITLLLVDGKNN
ncbi:MAG: hypothetical protein JKY89_10260 [Immundisolibacteraceae bacterium]|nr:hypothetical protein [Immundisolibacteraceae bacterium]